MCARHACRTPPGSSRDSTGEEEGCSASRWPFPSPIPSIQFSVPDLPFPLPLLLQPAIHQPVGPDDLAQLFYSSTPAAGLGCPPSLAHDEMPITKFNQPIWPIFTHFLSFFVIFDLNHEYLHVQCIPLINLMGLMIFFGKFLFLTVLSFGTTSPQSATGNVFGQFGNRSFIISSSAPQFASLSYPPLCNSGCLSTEFSLRIHTAC